MAWASLPTGLGSEPKIQVGPGQSEGVWAQCTSEGWYPEPQVEWRDLGGQSLPSVTNLSASPTTGLFSVVSNVTLLDRDVEGLSCSIISSLLQRRKVAKSYLPGECSVLFRPQKLGAPQTISSSYPIPHIVTGYFSCNENF